MISVADLELRAGARLLMEGVSFRIDKGDKIGLVGRNGAGKTTMTRVLAGESLPAGGARHHHRRPSATCRRIRAPPTWSSWPATASSRPAAWTTSSASSRSARTTWPPRTTAVAAKAMRQYDRIEAEFIAGGGYAAESEAAAISNNLALPERLLNQPLSTLSGGQRRRVELARILYSDAETLLLDEPTNHLDADSITWLRGFLANHQGGLLVISHDTSLLEATVNKVIHLDANRATMDVYNLGWKRYLAQRETDERARKRERANTEKKATTLLAQANKMKARASGASAAQSMLKRVDRLMGGLDDVRVADRVAALRFPDPAPCGKTPLMAEGLSKSYGSLEIFTDVSLAIDRGSKVVILGLNGAGKTTLLRMLAGVSSPDTGDLIPGHGLKIGYFAQEHDTLDVDRTVLENMRSAAPSHMGDAEVRGILGSFMFSGDDVDKPAGVLSGGEKTRLALATIVASSANVLLLDEPTNNLDPASRAEILSRAVQLLRRRGHGLATMRARSPR